MKTSTNGNGPIGPEDDDIRRLLEDAGRKPDLPDEDLSEIKAAAREVWQRRVSERRSSFRRWIGLAAALVIAVVGFVLTLDREPTPGHVATIARCERVAGSVVAVNGGGESLPVAIKQELGEGVEIRVNDGVLALRVGEDVSLRLASSTRVTLASPNRVELASGAVYIDTGGHGGTLEVVTPFGSARDIGTQFQVRVDESSDTMRVSVREGQVVVTRDGDEHAVETGRRVTLSGDGFVATDDVAAWGEEWSWVIDAAPRFEIEGRTLAAFLDWVTHETGLVLRYDDREVEKLAGETTLHGSTGEMRADEAALVVLPGAGLEGKIVDGVIEVRRAN